MIGEQIGKYKIVGHIGRGGMADVYKARHPQLNRDVAIKVLNRALVHSPEMLERFQREGRAVAALHHLNIVQVYDLDVLDGIYFMVMEYVSGETLAHRLNQIRRRGERMPLHDVLDIIGAVGEALHYAHEQGMLHRDIKPANIMFRGDGSVVLTDFGVAKILNVASDITASGAVAGTPAYMAPEQWTNDEPDTRSDIYSLGVVLYQVVTGELPFNAETPGRLMFKHISEPPPLPHKFYEDIPMELERIILRTLAKDPNERYQTAKELANDLKDVIYQVESTAATGIFARPQVVEPTPRSVALEPEEERSRRRLPLLWLGVGAVLALIILIGLLFSSGIMGGASSSEEPPDVEATLTALLETQAAILTTSPTSTPKPSAPPTAGTPTRTPTAMATATATATAAPGVTPTVSQSQPTAPTVCTPTMTLVQDVNYHNFEWWGSVRTDFEKTWTLRKDGDCPWPQDIVLVHLDGNAFGLSDPLEVDWADDEIELSVSLRVPGTLGQYEGQFQLQTSEGVPIGEPLMVKIEARARITPTPTARPSVGPLEALNYHLIEWGYGQRGDVWYGTVVLVAQGGTGEYTWYRDTLDSEPLPGNRLEFEWGICGTFVGTAHVRSGDEVDHIELYIEFPDTESCQ